ncbi:hypothetical protein B9G69_004390 [Bdellovibrio sp. SKB1291214]|uniref:hypothetical protein n=1 Tax=Bdellovibrio sp. SKB1291214 TaxID=1732569 RepID=UPI0020CD775C|nr:hypothetical protein [Bdellovibrio sp. SKB1291214]UYL09813.1 hypothetical protein B9G69_004390 [Bdellovibrio sp. SKB1291214]
MRSLLLLFLLMCFSSESMAAEPSSASSSSGDWKFGVGAGYSPNFLVNLRNKETPTSGTMTEKTYDMEYAGAAGFSIHYWYVPQDSWAFISGFDYGAERELKKITLNGISTTNISNPSKYQQHNLYIGTAYRWTSFYIPIALNYGIISFTPASTFLGSYEAKSGLGAMLG